MIRPTDERLQLTIGPGVDESLASQVVTWAGEVLERAASPPLVTVTLWRYAGELEAFYRTESEELGVVGEDAGFLATHEAWRGYPRIHLCQERLAGVAAEVLRGAIHHEMAHAAIHGKPEFYSFRFTRALQEAAAHCGMDFPSLQRFVYYLSVAVKDADVVRWLAEISLPSPQRALLEFLLSETEDERRTWEAVCDQPPLRKIALAAFLKTLLPGGALSDPEARDASSLRVRWLGAFGWLPGPVREALVGLAHDELAEPQEAFQARLQRTALQLLANPIL